jgi:hypothetical protein
MIKTLDTYPYPNPDSLETLDPDPDSMIPGPQHCEIPYLVTGEREQNVVYGEILRFLHFLHFSFL